MPAKCLVRVLMLLMVFMTCRHAAAAKQRTKREIVVLEGPCDEPVWERGLADSTVSAASLAEGARQYHGAGASVKHFKGSVLAYVTPWHRSGYDAAVRFRSKLSHVSPVWYQLRMGEDGGLLLLGAHEVNASWLAELRTPPGGGGDGGDGGGAATADAAACEGDEQSQTCKAAGALQGHSLKVLPRVIVELQPKELSLLLSRPGPAIERLVKEAETHGYDGLVLEAWNQWAAMGGMEIDGFRTAALGFIRQLGSSLAAAAGKELILAVPPALPAGHRRPFARPEHLAQVLDVVSGLSVMTYDYSADPSEPGPNAPLDWQEKNLQLLLRGLDATGVEPQAAASKLLLGQPFYGYDFTRHSNGARDAAAVTSTTFLDALAKHQPELHWSEAAEHFIKYKDGRVRHTLYYPTPAMLQARVELAQRYGAGLSVWELGQGYDALFDVL